LRRLVSPAVQAYSREQTPLEEIEACSASTSFQEGLYHVQECFPLLHEFSGGTATVFPGTSKAESDVSVLKWSRDEFCAATTDFLLEVPFMPSNIGLCAQSKLI
jgi:hypothetical protein